MGCALVWLEPRPGERLGVSLGMLVAKIEEVGGGQRYKLTRVERVGWKAEHKVTFVSSLRAVHVFKREVEQVYGL